MNIFHKIALQGLKKNRTRTVVTIIGVILSSLMITGVTIFAASLMNYMEMGAVKKYGSWNAAFLDADIAFIQERLMDSEVKSAAAFENVGYAKLSEAGNPDRPYLFVAGFEEEAFDALPVTLMTGRFPENDRELLVSARAAAEGGWNYRVGEEIVLSMGSRIKEGRELTQDESYAAGEETYEEKEEKVYTIVGICRTPSFEPENAPGYTLITKSDAPEKDASFSLFVTLKTPRRVYSYADEVKGEHACILNYDVLRIMGISDRASDQVLMVFLYSFGVIVLAIIMIGSVFLIYNSFSISLSERIREIGVLASVGATARQLKDSVLFEGLCIGVIGIPIGILAGLGVIGIVLSAVSRNFGAVLFSGVSMELYVSPPAIIGAAVISMVTILISAYLPVRKVVKLPVMECIRQTNEIKVEAGAMKISKRKQRLYGLEGTLALKNFKRNKKRYRSIVLSLVLSIVLFVSTNALIDSMRKTIGRDETVSDYDIGLGTRDMEDEELFRLFERLKTAEGVESGSVRAVIPYTCKVPADRLTDAYREAVGENGQDGTAELSLELHFFDDDFYRKLIQDMGLTAEDYTGQDGSFVSVAKINDDSEDVKGVEDLADIFKDVKTELSVAPELTDEEEAGRKKGGGQSRNISVTAMEIVPPDIPPALNAENTELLPYTFEILAPWSAKEILAPSELPVDTKVKGLCFDAEKPSQTIKEMQKILQEDKITASYTLIDSAGAFEELRNYIFIANVFSYTFIAIISLIAAANVFNTISTNIRLRRRELAMLRSVGMSDKDFNRMMRLECALYGMKALVIGVPLSLVTAAVIVKVMTTDEVKFTLPWLSVGISALSVFIVIFVTMMYAVSKIRKENIIDALRDEMT